MGDVAITLKVMPESPEIDTKKMMSEISSAIKKLGINVKSIEEKPIAFGLKCLELLLVMPDQGGTDKIEETIKKIHGVASIESGDITLL
ncbi:MAG: elongation factor 1-beta [Candidatus Aenigmarchaeota archaeon]|nr:elongation factor 1-beta [Candidatus Aenigmarchaeota archaeon]